MTALNEASMKLAKLAVERHRSGRCASISQLDCILCEDFVTLHVWVYFADDTDAMFIVDLPAAIDPASLDPVGFAEALESAGAPGFSSNILVILDISDPARPKEAGRWWMPGQKVGREGGPLD